MLTNVTLDNLDNYKTVDFLPELYPPESLSIFLSLAKSGDMARSKIDVLSDRKQFYANAQINPQKFYAVFQKHTRDVIIVEKEAPAFYHDIVADGMVTNRKDIMLGVTVADCLPVFIIDKSQGFFGVVHSGWKGTGIALEAVKMMTAQWRTEKKTVKVIIGPGIGDCCYVVDKERADYFSTNFGRDVVIARDDKYFLSLRQANINLLETHGIEDINVITNCTCCTPALHSYRRQGHDNFKTMLACIGYRITSQ